jgi:hypothetical protein
VKYSISNSQQGISNFQGAWVATSFLTTKKDEMRERRLGLRAWVDACGARHNLQNFSWSDYSDLGFSWVFGYFVIL